MEMTCSKHILNFLMNRLTPRRPRQQNFNYLVPSASYCPKITQKTAMAVSFRGAAISIGKRANAYYSSPLPANHLGIKYHNLGSNVFLGSIRFPLNQTGYMFSARATNGGGSATVLDPVTPKKENEEESSVNWKIKMLYDGDCPLCMREVNVLRERNKSYATIKFVDISSDKYCPEENQGLDYETVMGRIHAIQSDGTVVTDIEAFRRLYEAVGLGWVYAITKYEPVATIADAIYGVWAKYRLQITGRPPLEEVLEARRNKRALCNDGKTCKTWGCSRNAQSGGEITNDGSISGL